MKIGYARVSTQDQSLMAQVRELKKAGCRKIYKEKVSTRKKRPQLDLMISELKPQDVVIVCKIDRLGRSLIDLVSIIDNFKNRDIQFISLSNNVDTTTAQGRFFFSIIASFAELERELISERTKFSLKALKESGVKLGKPAWKDKEQINRAKRAYEMRKTMKIQPICDELNISRVTFHKYIKWAENQGFE